MFGNIVDWLGTAVGAKDYGISEWLAGGKKTANTGNRAFNREFSPFVTDFTKAMRSENKGTGYEYVPDPDSHTTGDDPKLTDTSTSGAYGGAYGGGGGSQYTNTTAARAAEQARIDSLRKIGYKKDFSNVKSGIFDYVQEYLSKNYENY